VPLGVDRTQLVVHLVWIPVSDILQARHPELEEACRHLRPDVGYLLEPGDSLLALRRYVPFNLRSLNYCPRHTAPSSRKMFSTKA
jgi:hypothetical protein